jgi:hypothetical protein
VPVLRPRRRASLRRERRDELRIRRGRLRGSPTGVPVSAQARRRGSSLQSQLTSDSQFLIRCASSSTTTSQWRRDGEASPWAAKSLRSVS